MNKIDIVRAVKNQQNIFTPENTGCIDLNSFQAIAEAILETKSEGYITGEIKRKFAVQSLDVNQVLVEGQITLFGEELLEMEEAKGSIY